MKKRGLIALEAALMIFLLVAFFYVMISYALLARTEVFVQNSLNQAAKEFSQYTYLLGSNNHDEYKEITERIMLVTTSIEKLHDNTKESVETVGESGFSIDEISAEVNKFKNNVNEVQGNVEKVREYLSDPQKFLAVILQVVKEEVVIKKLSPFIIEQIYKDVLTRNKIDLSTKGVVGEVKFTGSEYNNDSKILTITIEYETKGLFYDYFKIKKVVKQKTAIRLWSGG